MTARPRRVTLHRVVVPLRNAFEAAHGTEDERHVTLVEVEAEDGVVGWGECDALRHPTYTHEWAAGAFLLLREELVPALLDGRPSPDRWHPMAAAALRDALLDADLRRQGRSLAAHLGARRASLDRTVVVGRAGDVDTLLALVERARGSAPSLVKLKVGSPADLQALVEVRRCYPNLPLAADANGAFDGVEAGELAVLERLDLAYLEQPHSPDRVLVTAELARRVRVPVALDETITSQAAAEFAADLGACGAVNVKPARLGGVAAAAELVAWAAGRGLPAFVGGMLELGVGRASAAAVAALEGCCWPTDLGPSAHYVDVDVTEPVVADDGGRLVVPAGPGIGVTPVAGRLDAVTVERVVLSA